MTEKVKIAGAGKAEEPGQKYPAAKTGAADEQHTMADGQRVIFLDRDGTLNEEVEYLYRPGDLKLIPGAAGAIRRLRQAGYQIVVITNQAGVARGYYAEEDVKKLHCYMNQELERQGAHVDGFYYCPHHPEHGIGEYRAACHCRKPETGLFEQAEKQFKNGVNKEESYMIGDKLLDAQAGHNYGVKSILVGTGYGSTVRREQEQSGQAVPGGGCHDGSYEYFAEDLAEAADWILRNRIAAEKAE